MKDSEHVFIWYLIYCPARVMQAIPGEIKTLVIWLSNEMPDENTDQNTTQPPYRLTTYFRLYIKNARECLTMVSKHEKGYEALEGRNFRLPKDHQSLIIFKVILFKLSFSETF